MMSVENFRFFRARLFVVSVTVPPRVRLVKLALNGIAEPHDELQIPDLPIKVWNNLEAQRKQRFPPALRQFHPLLVKTGMLNQINV